MQSNEKRKHSRPRFEEFTVQFNSKLQFHTSMNAPERPPGTFLPVSPSYLEIGALIVKFRCILKNTQ